MYFLIFISEYEAKLMYTLLKPKGKKQTKQHIEK